MSPLIRPGKDAAIKVALITMFEPGGGQQGELTRFRKGLRLRPWNVPGTKPGTSWRNEEGVAALVAGVGPVNTAVNVLFWALEAGVDWRHTFWLVCGIAGGNPARCSLGSPVWAEWVVDGDLAYDIHPQDAPRGWTTGILPLGASRPFGRAEVDASLFGKPAQVFHLNDRLANWAWKVSRRVPLADPVALSRARKAYQPFAHGAGKPTVVRGAVLSAARSGMAPTTMLGLNAGCATGPTDKDVLPPRPWKIPGPWVLCDNWITSGWPIGVGSWCCEA